MQSFNYHMKHQSIYNRLRRIEGQIRGLEEMLAKEKPEQEILIQLEATRSSLASTLSSFLAEIIESNKDDQGAAVISSDWVRSLLRFIKKN